MRDLLLPFGQMNGVGDKVMKLMSGRKSGDPSTSKNGDEGQAVLGELDRIHEKNKPVDLSACTVAYCFLFSKSCLIPHCSTELFSLHSGLRLQIAKTKPLFYL